MQMMAEEWRGPQGCREEEQKGPPNTKNQHGYICPTGQEEKREPGEHHASSPVAFLECRKADLILGR